MLEILKRYLNNITKSLNYIIEKNLNIDVEKEDTDEYSYYLESLDFEYLKSGCERYIIFIGDRKFYIDFALPIGDAKYITEHIDDISYLYSELDQTDSICGSVNELFNGDFVKCRLYERFVENCDKVFSKKEILEFIERG